MNYTKMSTLFAAYVKSRHVYILAQYFCLFSAMPKSIAKWKRYFQPKILKGLTLLELQIYIQHPLPFEYILNLLLIYCADYIRDNK